MRQLDHNEIVPPIEVIGVLDAHVRVLLEERGVRFVESQFDGPGPTQWAAVALEDGAQVMLVHHYAHPDRFVELVGQMDLATPAALCHRFAVALGIEDSEFSWIAEDWPRRHGG